MPDYEHGVALVKDATGDMSMDEVRQRAAAQAAEWGGVLADKPPRVLHGLVDNPDDPEGDPVRDGSKGYLFTITPVTAAQRSA